MLVGTNVHNALEASQASRALLPQQHLDTVAAAQTCADTHTAEQGLSPPDADIGEKNAHTTVYKTKGSFCPQFYYSLELMVLAVWQE